MDPLPEINDLDGFVQQLTGCQDDLAIFIRMLCGDFHTALDIRQEVNMVVWRKRREFQPGTNFRSWAYRIAHFEAKSFSRKERRQKVKELDPELLDLFVMELPATVDEMPERRMALSQCMEGLTPKDHELLQHRYWSGGSLETLAESTGRSVGTLKARLFQLRTALRLCIRKRIAEEAI